ncbi:MAG: hypothetical protein JOZ57_11410, partial [Abitibacteriaceae bacterium]|nr:hypothetical protein [Abditibacteriaceae bacterium]
MKRISALLQAEPINTELIHTALERLGLGEWTTINRKQVFSTTRAAKLIEGLAKEPADREALLRVLDDLLQDLAEAAAPLRALVNFARLVDVVGNRTTFFSDLQKHPAMRGRLCRLLSFSQALADVLIRQPELLALMRTAPQSLSRNALRRRAHTALQDHATPQAQLEQLRRFRRRETLRIGLLDMQSQTWRDVEDFEAVVHQISDLAQVCVEQTLAILAQETANNSQDSNGSNRSNLPFVVMAMGKLGARELNYSSDIDLVFIHDGDEETMQKLGQRLLVELTASTAQGVLYRVDMRLRPEGKSGPLVTSLDYALSYYESYAAAWEWQALIKARVVAGDAHLGRRFRKFTRGVTWAKRADDAHLREILDMKRRSETTAEGSDATNVKQGPGGIRDAEWTVQQLQMMVGPEHPRVRAHDTLRAVEALEGFGALSFEEANRLRDGYLFLRVVEHRLQLLDERAVRTLPKDDAERIALARRTGCPWRGKAALRWLEEEHTRHRADIRALCERMFWGWQDTAEGERGRGGEEEKEGGGTDAREVSDYASGSHSPSPLLPLS